MGIFSLLNGGVLIMIISAIFVSMGIVGACKRRPRLLIAHFAYSLALYILTLIGIIMLIIYCIHCSFFAFVLGFVFLILQAVGMRHSRILIGYARLYPNSGCAYRCASRCSQQRACAQPQQLPTVSEQPQQQQQPQQMPVQQVPQYYPTQMVVPQPYFPMQQQMRYPVMPQGMQMMPMGVQPYMVFPQAPQDPSTAAPSNQQQTLYPSVPIVYRQV
jgi:uncharacterized membrane protein